MPTIKKETPVEGEVVTETRTEDFYESNGFKRPRTRPGLFFGLVLLVWGGAIILDTYFHTNLMENLWPILAVILGLYLIISSFNSGR